MISIAFEVRSLQHLVSIFPYLGIILRFFFCFLLFFPVYKMMFRRRMIVSRGASWAGWGAGPSQVCLTKDCSYLIQPDSGLKFEFRNLAYSELSVVRVEVEICIQLEYLEAN